MRKITYLICFILLSINLFAQSPKNLTQLGLLPFPGQTLAGCWHYNDTSGHEYAIVGASQGLAIIDITDPTAPSLIIQTPGPNSLWHEVKVLGDYAYGVSEGFDASLQMNGLQIIDLRYLPDSAPTKFYTGDGAIFNQLETAHTITADGHYVYVNGHNINVLNNGILILDVTDPWNPVYTGAITNSYCHDSYVRGDTLYSSEIYAGVFSIFDISDRTSPNLITSQATPALFNHNAWLSDDSRYLFVTDEKTNAPMTSYDVSDFTNITQLDTFYNGNFTSSEVHNVRVINDYVLAPSYGSQLTIVDASHPYNMIEVANYPTGTSLCWDADPYTNSGNIIATDMNSGNFFVFGPTYQRACYLEGNVTDSLTGIAINGVSVSLPSISITASTAPSGNYATGFADSGSYQVSFTKAGYVTKTFTVSLNNGQTVTLDVQLVPVGAGVNYLHAQEFSAYPNPAQNEFTIQSSNGKVKAVNVFDVSGKLVLTADGLITVQHTLDISNLAPGKYTAAVTTENGVESIDFLKLGK
jgi:choice-of-anchor B domain-containing protein